MSASVPLGALIGWMVLLTVKHVIADFVLQTSWMAIGKDQRTGWFFPLLAHWGVHFAVAMTFILIVGPRFWFVAVIDFAIHITIDRCKGIIASRCGVTQETQPPWFWTLIGVDQALHHLTDFGLSIFMAAKGCPAGFRICIPAEYDQLMRSDIPLDRNPAQSFVQRRARRTRA